MMEEGEFIEAFVRCPHRGLRAARSQGLYSKARAGQIKNFTGVDSVYEPPENPNSC